MAPPICAERRRAALTPRPLSLALAAALGASACLAPLAAHGDPAPEPSPVASPAPIAYEFSSDFLAGSASGKVDLSRFALGNPQLAGNYRADVYLNGRWLVRRDVRLAGSPVVPCVDADLLRMLSVSPSALSPDGAAMLSGSKSGAPAGSSTSCAPMESLARDSSARFEAGELRLDITVAQASLARQAKGYVPPASWDRGVTAGLLAYNLNAYRTSGKSSTDALYVGLNGGVNVDRWRLRHSGNFTKQSRLDAQYTGLGTYLATDVPDWQAALSLGDINTTGQLFPTARVRGVSVSTDDRMLPESRRGYAPVIRGVANSNARVEIRQNGNLIYSTTVPPGPFEINDLYPTGYGGDLVTTVTEADGSQRTTSMPFSSLPQLLRAGTLYYSGQAGQLRGFQGNYYLAQGTAQYGISNDWTVAGGVQLSDRYTGLLAGSAWNTPVGAVQANIVGASLARSGQPRTNGWSLDASWAKVIPATSTNLSLAAYRYSSSGFYTLDEAVRLQDLDAGRYGGSTPGWRLRHRAVLSVYQTLPAGVTLNLSANTQNYWNRSARQSSFQMGLYKQWGNAQFSLNAISNRNLLTGDTQRTYSVGLTLPLGGSPWARQNVSAYATHDTASGDSQRIGLFGNMGERGELSYSVNAQNGSSGRSLTANGAYAGRYAMLTASASSGLGTQQQSFGASGGIVAADGHVVFAPYLGETIGLLRVEGGAGIRVSASQASELDSSGYTLLPYLSPYTANQVELNLDKAPISARFDANSATVAPHAGAVVLLNFKRMPGYTLLLRARRADGSAVPFGASVYDAQGTLVGSVGQAGRIEAASPSLSGDLQVSWGAEASASCAIRFDIPPPLGGQDALVQASVVCRPLPAAGGTPSAQAPAGDTAATTPSTAVVLTVTDAQGRWLPPGAQLNLPGDESRMCSSMPSSFMTASVPMMVVGTMAPTISPVRRPRKSTTMPITMTVVSRKTCPTWRSWRVTICAWSVMGISFMPTGRPASSVCMRTRRRSAKLTTFRPGDIDTAITAAGAPSTNAPPKGGSCSTRSTLAIRPSGTLPPAGSGMGVVASCWGSETSPVTVRGR